MRQRMRQRAGRESRLGTIRARLAAILAVPLIAVLVLVGNLVLAEIGEYRAANAVTASTRIGMAAQNLANELQHERGLSMGVLAGAADDRAELDELRPVVDGRRVALTAALSEDSRPHGTARTALAQLNDLTTIRTQIDDGRIDRPVAFQYFGDRITAFNDVDLGLDEPSPAPDPTLRRALAAFAAIGSAREAAASEAALLVGTLTTGKFARDEYSQFISARAARQLSLTEYARHATSAQRAAVEAAARMPQAAEAMRYEQTLLPASDGRHIGIYEEDWWLAMTAYAERLRQVQVSIGDSIHKRTGELRNEATVELLLLIPFGLLAIIATTVLVRFASASIVRPLTALMTDTETIAAERLPAAVARIQTGEAGETGVDPPDEIRPRRGATVEIASVAQAVNRMQQTAYGLAVEQATLRRNTIDSLANLGRRTQNLLRRQLAFISQLEREEGDPTILANLFELDHLATRLRRNAESLLVLVGEQTPRRWTTPLPIADVIRAAVAEVEDYRRVSLRRIDPAFLGGGLVTDVAHLVAELIENGLTFSSPEFDVEVHGRHLGADYLIAIIDHGIGMTGPELATANARLRGEDRFTVAPTRFLGHYVVGELARELDIDVQVVQSPVTGITARVVLPGALLAASPDLSSPVEPTPPRQQAPTADDHGRFAAPAVQPTVTFPSTFPLTPRLALTDQRVRPATGGSFKQVPLDTRTIDTRTIDAPAVDTTARLDPPRADTTRRFQPPTVETTARLDPPTINGTAGFEGTTVDAADGFDRTRNGLPKRRSRPRTVTAVQPPRNPAGDAAGATTGADGRGPSQPAAVRSMLTALRDGVDRGHRTGSGERSWFTHTADHETERGEA